MTASGVKQDKASAKQARDHVYVWIARRTSDVARVIALLLLVWALAPAAGLAAWLLALFMLPVLNRLVTLAHELGHAATAICCGGEVTMIAVRPVALRFAPLRFEWIGRRRYRGWLPSGRTEYRFKRRHGKWWGVVSAGGAAAVAIVGIVCLIVGILSQSGVVAGTALAASVLAVASVVVTMLPYRGSDLMELVKLRRARSITAIGRARLPPLPGSPKSET